MTERADQRICINASSYFKALVQAFLTKHRVTQVCQHPYSPDLAPHDFWLFPWLKLPFKGRDFVNATVTQYTSSISGASLLNDQPHGRVTCSRMRGKVSSDWLPSYIKATLPVLEIFKMA